MENKQKYFIGLDIGTNSCGWAVTDTNYNLLRAKGKKMWGVRLFEEGKPAKDRRAKRTNRRRLDRRKLKLQWLQEIFAEEIAKVDPNFFTRLKYSSLWWDTDGEALSDKQKANANLVSKDSLFAGKLNGQPFTDKEYFQKYPTIYHLREALIKEPAEDIRLLYLATHNIIKRRGHFLMEGEIDANHNIDLLDLIQETFTCVQEFFESRGIELSLTVPQSKESVLEIIKNKELGKKGQKGNLVELCKATKEAKTIIESLITGKLNVKSILDLEEKLDFEFDKAEDFTAKLAEADFETAWLEKLYTLYSTLKMHKLLGENSYICQAMLDIFATHQEQLKFFKDFIKAYYPNAYFDMFRANNVNTNYALYVKGSIYNGKKQVIIGENKEVTKGRETEEFYKYVKKLLEKTPSIADGDDEHFEQQKQTILKWIEEDNFLPKQRTKSNSVWPNQLYKNELKKILEVSSAKYPFLKAIDSMAQDEKGQPLTTIDKILQILTFRVPYYIGPIVDKNKQEDGQIHSWIEKKVDIALRPWTLTQIVDLEDAEKSFIKNMTNTCTYLVDCDVLPKYSILYSKFRVLNELNNLKIDGQPITVELKQKIFTEIFLKEKNPSLNKVKELLVAEGLYTKEEAKTIEFAGIDKRFANNMNVYIQLKEILGEEFLQENSETVEEIILWMTVIEDKNRLQKRLEKHYSTTFSKEQITKLKGITCTGWGRFSKEFLELQAIDKDTGEIVTIIERLWNTNDNLTQILWDSKYNYQEKLQEILQEKPLATDEEIKEEVAKLYCSPMVKRGVLQTIKIIQEITEILGHKPDKIFVEVTRHDEEKGEKGRKYSRHKNLCDKFKSKEFKAATKDIANEVAILLEELNKKEETALRSDKLLLYFQQLGRCIYSGEKIDLEDIFDNNKYDIDHIYPQSFIKDDSINNRVLAKRELNLKKTNSYPLPLDWQNKQSNNWTRLKNIGLISQEKYNRLTRKEALTEQDAGQFVARQIVVTNQSAKAVIELLQKMVENPRDVVYSKAGLVSDFRHKYHLIKSREVNDLHHAKDAYLNIVVGNVVFNRFTDNPRNFYSKNYNDTKRKLTRNVNKLFENIVYNYTTGEVVWDGTEENEANDLKRVLEICNKNDILVSKMSFCNYNGAFYDETVYKKQDRADKKAKELYPLKGEGNLLANPYRYGGVKSKKGAFFIVLETVNNKGKRQRIIETIPIILYQQVKKQFKNEKDSSERECKILQKVVEKICQENKYKEYKLICKLNYKSTFMVDNGLYWLGKDGVRIGLHNANQWYVDSATTKYIKVLKKYSELKANKKLPEEKEENSKIVLSKASKEGNTEVALCRENNVDLYKKIVEQLKKEIYSNAGFQNLLSILQNNELKFKDITIYKQADLLLGVIKRIHSGASPADISAFGGSKETGELYLSKNISDKELYLIKTSVTGLTTSKISIGGIVNGKSILN